MSDFNDGPIVPVDKELHTFQAIVGALEMLDGDGLRRALVYVNNRYAHDEPAAPRASRKHA